MKRAGQLAETRQLLKDRNQPVPPTRSEEQNAAGSFELAQAPHGQAFYNNMSFSPMAYQ